MGGRFAQAVCPASCTTPTDGFLRMGRTVALVRSGSGLSILTVSAVRSAGQTICTNVSVPALGCVRPPVRALMTSAGMFLCTRRHPDVWLGPLSTSAGMLCPDSEQCRPRTMLTWRTSIAVSPVILKWCNRCLRQLPCKSRIDSCKSAVRFRVEISSWSCFGWYFPRIDSRRTASGLSQRIR